MVRRSKILANASYIENQIPNKKLYFWKIADGELLPKNFDEEKITKTKSSIDFLEKFGIFCSIIDTLIPTISEKGINEIIKLVKPYDNLRHYFVIETNDVGYGYIYTIKIKSLLNKIFIDINIFDCDNLNSLHTTFEFNK